MSSRGMGGLDGAERRGFVLLSNKSNSGAVTLAREVRGGAFIQKIPVFRHTTKFAVVQPPINLNKLTLKHLKFRYLYYK